MQKGETKKTASKRIVFILIGLFYFLLFIFPNLKGAQNADMLAVFEIDEYAQYPHLIRMLSSGDSIYQTIRNFTIYLHYFYGYPFYFFSAIVVLPVRLFFGAEWTTMTPVVIALLRQVISVLPMIGVVSLLVYFQTRYKTFLHSVALFLFLLVLPPVIKNNLWWHPDSLAFLFVALTFYFLDSDQQNFGRFFFFAAASCGLAIGTKHMGEFFVLAIPIYLLWGVVRRKINWQKAVLLAVGFVVVMFAFVIISNPLLLLPQERSEIIAVQKQQFFETTQGSLVANASFNLDSVRQNLGQLWFIALALMGMGLGIYRKKTRLRTVLILCWLLPLSYVIFFASPQRAHYYLNLGLPLYLCLDNFFNQKSDAIRNTGKKIDYRKLMQWGVGLLILIQFVIFLRTDIFVYRGGLFREENSQALQFYDRLELEVFSQLFDDAEDTLLVYRDWKIYCPPETGRQVVMNWGFATEGYI